MLYSSYEASAIKVNSPGVAHRPLDDTIRDVERSREWFTPDEAADYLRVSRATIYRLSEEGRLPYSEVEGGRGRRYRGEDLRRALRPDRSRVHATVAARFRVVHAELAAVVDELPSVAEDFGPGLKELVRAADFWVDVRDRAASQMDVHRDLATAGRSQVERLLTAALAPASKRGHRMDVDVRGADTAHARCSRCGAELTVGHPVGGGELEVLVNQAADASCPPAVDEIVRRFAQWEQAATRSPNSKVASSAHLEPPTHDAAAALLPRLHELRERLAVDGLDQHGRPVGNDEMAALGWLWEEWRDDILGERNGYRDVWTGPDDPLYDRTGRRS